MKSGLNIADKLLIASLEIEISGKKQFSAEDLVVSAWKMFPNAFGLKGYLDAEGMAIYPDSNRVYAEIMGSKPLRKRGLLQKVGNKMYCLTEAGRIRAMSVSGPRADVDLEKFSLARENVDYLRRLFESKACQKARLGNLEDVSFFDACGFWGISPGSGAKELWSKFARLEAVLNAAKGALGKRSMASSKHGAVPYTIEDINGLFLLHESLQKKFTEDIETINKRYDERKKRVNERR